MIQFNWINIKAYKAVADVTISFESGIIRVQGVNQDDPYDSNGAGKSTVLQALVFALYNKDFNGAPINSLGNRSLKREPSVILNFTDTVSQKTYQIVNDRNTKEYSLSIPSDDFIVSKGASDTLKEIQQILGMTYHTFKLTHFITGATIISIVEDLSQPVIFNDLLQISEYQVLDKQLLEVNKEVSQQIKELEITLVDLMRTQELKDITSKFDVEETKSKLESVLLETSVLKDSFGKLKRKLDPTLDSLKESLSELKNNISETTKTLSSGTCSSCGTVLRNERTLIELSEKLKDLSASQQTISLRFSTMEQQMRLAEIKHKTELSSLDELSKALSTELSVAEEVSKVAELQNKGKLVDNQKEISRISSEVKRLKAISGFLIESRKEIKTGNIVKELLDAFFLIVDSRMAQYSTLLNLTSFHVTLRPNSFGMRITIQQAVNGSLVEVPVETLSNGEKTRLSLLILVSMLDAMKVVSNCETNYLVFDEASSSFDKSGVQELSLLFNHLKTLGQSCFIITHGSEMEEVPFDFELTMTKSEGQSFGTLVPL